MTAVSQIRSESPPLPRLPVRHGESRIVVNDLRREIDRLRRAVAPDSVHHHRHSVEAPKNSSVDDSALLKPTDESPDHRVAYSVAPLGRWEMSGQTRFQIQTIRITFFQQISNTGSVVDVVG